MMTPDKPTSALKANDIEHYLNNWFTKTIDLVWHNYIKSVNNSKFYFGYWSFESAAITLTLGIDDARFKENPFYPTDLADFARNHIEEVVQLKEIDYFDFRNVLDSLQIASGYAIGIKKLGKILQDVNESGVLIKGSNGSTEIRSRAELRNFILKYDQLLDLDGLIQYGRSALTDQFHAWDCEPTADLMRNY